MSRYQHEVPSSCNTAVFLSEDEMRNVCSELLRKQYIQLRTLFVPLCLESHNRYCFNILRMITLLYNFYIENEIYHMAYNKIIYCLNENLFIEVTMSKWGEYITFWEILGKFLNWLYLKL